MKKNSVKKKKRFYANILLSDRFYDNIQYVFEDMSYLINHRL